MPWYVAVPEHPDGRATDKEKVGTIDVTLLLAAFLNMAAYKTKVEALRLRGGSPDVVNPEKLKAMRDAIANKYKHNTANYERNTGHKHPSDTAEQVDGKKTYADEIVAKKDEDPGDGK